MTDAAVWLPALTAGLLVSLPLALAKRWWLPSRAGVRAAASIAVGLTASLLVALLLSASANRETAQRLAQAEEDPAGAMRLLAEDLEGRLRESSPDDAQGWFLLGRARQAAGQTQRALAAYARSNALAEVPNPDWLVTEAEVRLAQGPEDPAAMDRARELLQRALAADAGHPGANFYAGLLALADGRTRRGVTLLQAALDSGALDSEVEALLRQRIAETGLASEPDGPAATPEATDPGATGTAEVGFVLEISAELPEKSLPPQATLFVFAREAGGQGMPLAATRIADPELPLTVRLGDEHRLRNGAPLSEHAELELSARLSSSGSATGAEGDPVASARWRQGEPRRLSLQLRPEGS